ncbi:NADPH:quinone reductase [Paecilomyces lecythidis]
MPLPSIQKAVVVEKVGGPEVLQYRTDYPVLLPKETQVLVKNAVSGINYIDTYFRSGLYPCAKPEVLGREAIGTVVALGENTEKYGFRVGDRVIWLGTGGYAEYACVSAERVVKLPVGLSDEIAIASFMSGLTVLALVRETYNVKSGDKVLLHAAAGGAGILMTQVLKDIGAYVIGTAGGPEKVALVKSLGADHVIDYRSEDWVRIVKRITDNQGVDVVYDSVGRDTCEGSLECVKRKGTIVWFGNSSGPIPPLPLNLLSPKAVKIARPTLLAYITTREELRLYSDELFQFLISGKLKVNIHHIYKLDDIQQAHKV